MHDLLFFFCVTSSYFHSKATDEANTKAKIEALEKRALKAEKAAAKAAEFGALVEEAGVHAASAQAAWQSERVAMALRWDEERQVGVDVCVCLCVDVMVGCVAFVCALLKSRGGGRFECSHPFTGCFLRYMISFQS